MFFFEHKMFFFEHKMCDAVSLVENTWYGFDMLSLETHFWHAFHTQTRIRIASSVLVNGTAVGSNRFPTLNNDTAITFENQINAHAICIEIVSNNSTWSVNMLVMWHNCARMCGLWQCVCGMESLMFHHESFPEWNAFGWLTECHIKFQNIPTDFHIEYRMHLVFFSCALFGWFTSLLHGANGKEAKKK